MDACSSTKGAPPTESMAVVAAVHGEVVCFCLIRRPITGDTQNLGPCWHPAIGSGPE